MKRHNDFTIWFVTIIILVFVNTSCDSHKKTGTATFVTVKEGHAISYDGKMVYENEDCYVLDIEKVFPIGTDKAALIEVNSGGTACPATYVFITARASGATVVSEEFGNCSDIPAITAKGDRVILAFPGEPPETWTYQNGNVQK